MILRRLIPESIRRGVRDWVFGDPEFVAPQEFRGDFREFLETFFEGVVIEDINDPGILRIIFGILFALNLSGQMERVSIPDNIRNELQNELNQLNAIIQSLQQQSQQSLQQIQPLIQNIQTSIDNILQMIQQPAISPQDVLRLTDAVNRLTSTLINLQNQAGLQNLQQNIQNLQASQKQIQAFLSRTVPESITRLYNFFNQPEIWQNIFVDERGRVNRRLLENFSRGLNRLQNFLLRNGVIQINLSQNNLRQLIQNAFETAGVQLDLNDQQTRELLGIRTENNQDYLVLSPYHIFGVRRDQGETFLSRIERELDSEEFERRRRHTDFTIGTNEERAKILRAEGDELRANILETYNNALRSYQQVEDNFKEMLKKFSPAPGGAFLSGKLYDKEIAADFISVYYMWERIRKAFDETRTRVTELVHRRDTATRRLENLLANLQRLQREIEGFVKLTNSLKEAIDRNAPKEVKNILKRMKGAGEKIMKAFSPILTIAVTGILGIVGMFIFGPWALNLLAAEIIERQLKRGSSSGK